MFLKVLLATMMAVLPQIALSQIYKCKNTQGKTTYSEFPCTSGTKGKEVNIEPNIIDNSGQRKQIAIQKSRENLVSIKNSTESNREQNNLMTEYDKTLRIRELKMDMNNLQSSHENRVDATNEFRYLNKNQVNSLSYDDELKRSNLKVGLESTVQTNRSKAMTLLTQIYVKY
ncbi:MAG: DUF4124 domain-containing protein [Methylophilaceae bacterium]